MTLLGKVALVTGGAQRAGRFIALALARVGADLVVNHFRTAMDAEDTRAQVAALGRRCLILEADVADPGQGRSIIQTTEKEFGRLDVLVHNASNFNRCPVLDVTEEIWESSLGVNLKGPFFLSQAAARLMLKNGSGRIIALIGNSLYENWPQFVPHAIAKTGLAKMMQSLAIALSPQIQCNAICPASFYPSEGNQTQVITGQRGEELHDRFSLVQGVKLHKGNPEEVAELVVYLAGCSNYLNGVVIPLDGGKQAI
jgi:NAD(P)-dependent dehydrogenase (short-subunit alcohol dehydrogenase family)